MHTQTEATKLFEDGSRLEEVGKVFEATHLYRRAMQIVPNIEMHVYQNEKMRLAAEKSTPSALISDPIIREGDASQSDEDLSNVDMMARFQEGCQQSGAFIQRGISGGGHSGVISKVDGPSSSLTGHHLQKRHIGDMPLEVLLYVLRWVVSGQLDLRSLERCALVSRGFYICARDPEIWRLACRRVWGDHEARIARPAFASWRHMYREKSRIHLHGVYISKTSYFRYGENSFQDQFYRPMHLIEYYRYVRFFADGGVYMLTTPDAPTVIVPRLVAVPRQPQRADLLCGSYRLEAGGIAVLQMRRNRVGGLRGKDAHTGVSFGRRRRASNANYEAADRNQTYNVEFRIRNGARGGVAGSLSERPSALVWTSYETYRDVDKAESVLHNRFELKPSMYPALVFSRVEEFHSVSTEPLA